MEGKKELRNVKREQKSRDFKKLMKLILKKKTYSSSVYPLYIPLNMRKKIKFSYQKKRKEPKRKLFTYSLRVTFTTLFAKLIITSKKFFEEKNCITHLFFFVLMTIELI